MADFAICWGGVPALVAALGRPLTGEEIYGLWLNRDRARLQAADTIALAVKVALGTLRPGAAWYDAVCATAEEAAEAHYRADADRAEAEAKRRPG